MNGYTPAMRAVLNSFQQADVQTQAQLCRVTKYHPGSIKVAVAALKSAQQLRIIARFKPITKRGPSYAIYALSESR